MDLFKKKPFTILFNGSWIKRKGTAILIAAAKILFGKGYEFHYLLIGTGSDVQHVSCDWPEQLRQFITVIPRFKESEEINYINISSLFILPSYYEGQPLSLLQAMAAGKCCIATNCCGQKDVIKDKVTGLLFSVGDYEALAMMIELCYNNSHLSAKIGENAMQDLQHRTWKNVSSEVVNYVISNL